MSSVILCCRWNDDQGVYTCAVNVNGKIAKSNAKVYIEAQNKHFYDDLQLMSTTKDVDRTKEDDDAMSDSTLVSESACSFSSNEGQPENQIDESFSELLDQTNFGAFCQDSNNSRHHILSPILEENEDSLSVISSLLPHQNDYEYQSDDNLVALHQAPLQSASYDSLASFEANEKLMMMLDGTPRRETKIKYRKQSDIEEQDILNYALRRQKNFLSNSPVSRPITSHTFYLSNFSPSVERDGKQPSNIGNTMPISLPSNAGNQEIKNKSNINYASNLNMLQIKDAKNYNNSSPTLKTQRLLSLHSLERNFPSKQINEPICTNYSTDDEALDAFEDRVIGYLAQRQRDDSVFDFDLSSLHKEIASSNIKNLQTTENESEQEKYCNEFSATATFQQAKESKSVVSKSKYLDAETKNEINEEASTEASDNCYQDCEDKTTVESQHKNSAEQLSETSTPNWLATCDQDLTKDSQSQTMQSLCNFNDSAFETVSSCESDFHSCASSISTNIQYEVPNIRLESDDVLSDPGYKTPPESNENYETPIETDSDDSGTAVLSSVKSVLSPPTTTVTSGATGYQTPPKWYYVIPPKFIGNKIQEITVVRGGAAVLECSIVSHPEAKVAWYKDGRLLEIYDRISQHTSNQPAVQLAREYVESSSWNAPLLLPTEIDIDIGCVPQLDVHYLLKIKNAMTKDEGSYVCKAWNSAGVATRIIQLTVSNRPL